MPTTKLNIASSTTTIMFLLCAFSKQLHIPEAFQQVLMLGALIPFVLTFYFIRKYKQEMRDRLPLTGAALQAALDGRRRMRREFILILVLSFIAWLCSPVWLPWTGTSLDTQKI